MAKRKWHGDYWTQQKLEKLELYAAAFQENMAPNRFTTMWVDACSGTGHVDRRKPRVSKREGFFPEPPNISEGSARRAMKLQRPFDRYVLIERNRVRFGQLKAGMQDFPTLGDRITLRRWDANNYIPKLCSETDWENERAVVFLDPPGTQIAWDTVKAIGETGAADLWYLFPLGQAVNRLLRVDQSEIENSHRLALDRMFGASDWYDRFYKTFNRVGFLPREETIKVATTKGVIDYFVERLKTAFPHVIEWPYRLFNRKGIPLFVLCYASPSRYRTWMASEILRRPSGLAHG